MNNQSILFIGGLLDVGGAGKMLKFVANVCADIFSDVSILSCSQTERPNNINSQIHFFSTSIPSKITIKSRIHTMREIRSIVKKLSPDIVCAFTSEISVMSRLATLGLKTKFVSAERGDPYTLPFIWKVLARTSYSLSNACIFQLEGARDFFGKGVAKKSFVIPNPFVLSSNVEPYCGVRKKTIVSAGRFQPEKRFNVLIDAFSIVISKYPDYSLTIFGEGPLLSEYKKQLEKLDLSEKVSFPGYISNVAEGVRQEGIFVLPSLYEGIPNVLLEAISVGIPSVATDCSPGGPAFLLDNGARGLIVPLEDSEKMAQAIIKLIEDKELYHRYEAAGPAIRKELEPRKIASLWKNTFVLVLKS